MRYLTIEEYDETERRAMERLPNRVVEAFQPIVFSKLGYPVHVRSDHELRRYIDVMHENRFADYFNQILSGLTPDEFDDFQGILAAVCDFTEDHFGKVAIARGTILQSMNVLRHIDFLPYSASPRVLELGPGSGCLGAGLMLKGCPYASMDVTQAFYLYQNRFFTHLTQGKLVDGVLSGAAPAELLTYIPQGGGVHIPWWQYAELTPEEMPAFDIVTCNHAICEMHGSSLRFSLLLAQAALGRSADPFRAFIFQGWGQSGQTERAAATRLFYDFGFRLVHNDHNIVVFVPADSPGAVGHLVFPEGRSAYPPVAHSSKDNPLSQAIADGRTKIRDYQYVGLDQLETLLTVIIGSDQHMTEDEMFSAKEELQKIINEANATLEATFEKKQTEVMG